MPLAGNERPAGWQYLRHKFIGAMPPSLSLRGGRRPTWQSRSTRPNCGKAIGENAAAFPRLPRRFAPRNDTSGSAVVHQRPPTVELPCTGRSLSAATVKFDSDCVRRHSVYIGSAFPRLHPKGTSSRFALRVPRPLRGLAMTRPEAFRILHFSVFIHFRAAPLQHTTDSLAKLSTFHFRFSTLPFSSFRYFYINISGLNLRKSAKKSTK